MRAPRYCGKFFDLKCPLNKPQQTVREGFEMLQSTGESVYKAVIEHYLMQQLHIFDT